jgi:hypothetical protein
MLQMKICFSKNGGSCILLDNNQGRKEDLFFGELVFEFFVAQCLCTPVFRGLTCNQFSYIPCGDATCHGTQVRRSVLCLD